MASDPFFILFIAIFIFFLILLWKAKRRSSPPRKRGDRWEECPPPYNRIYIPDEGRTIEVRRYSFNTDGSALIGGVSDEGWIKPFKIQPDDIYIRGGNAIHAMVRTGNFIKLNAALMDSNNGHEQYKGKWAEIVEENGTLKGEVEDWESKYRRLEARFYEELNRWKEEWLEMQAKGGAGGGGGKKEPK